MVFKTGSALFFAIILISILFSGHLLSASENSGSEYQLFKGSSNNKINPDDELDKLNGLIKRGVKNADVYYNRAWVYALKGETEKAKNDYTQAIKLDSRHADAYFNRGLILLNEGRYKDAVNDFTRAIDIKPEVSDTYCNRGNAYFLMGKALLALKDYNTAIRLSGDDPDLYYNRAMIYEALGRNREAKDDFLKASELKRNRMTEVEGEGAE